MTKLDVVVYVLFAIATPLFIAFELWYWRQKHRRRQH
jgi:hypothetical protein